MNLLLRRNTLVGPQLQASRRFHPDWKRLIAFLGAIALGCAVATQWLANSYGFQPALGFSLFHLYPPWSYFVWAYQWKDAGNHLLFDRAFGIGSLVTFAGCFVILVDLARANFRVNPYLHGSARWADKGDIKRAGLFVKQGVYVGGWRDKRGLIRYLRHNGPEHVLCYAPTRSGKGVGLVVPTLLSWTQSVFVTDLKGELYELTAGWRQKYAHNKILRFEPAASEHSCCFNPLEELRIGTEYEVGDVQNLALLIADPRGAGIRPGDYFPEAAYSLLVGCILHLCYKSRREGVRATFSELDAMLATPGQDIKDLWREMFAYAHAGGRNHPAVGRMGQEMLNMAANQASGVLSTTRNFLSLYRDPTVARNTNRSDFRIRDLMHHNNPVSLYIVTQPVDKDRLRPLVRIMVNMIVRLLADKMEFKNGRPRPAYKHKLLAMIDEFPALGKLEILEQSLAFVAGYGIKCYLIAQDINQLKSRETGYGPDESITSNCGIQTAFPPNRLETAEHLSRLTGQTTIIKEQVTRSGRGLGVQMSTSMTEVQRPLLTPDECLRMPGPQKDGHDRITVPGDMVVYCAGFPAIYGRQPLYFQDPTFSARAAIEPPKHSDSL
jgi:type IV secretion system protein VirD4